MTLLHLYMTLYLSIVYSYYRSHSSIYRNINEVGANQGHVLLAELLDNLSTCCERFVQEAEAARQESESAQR